MFNNINNLNNKKNKKNNPTLKMVMMNYDDGDYGKQQWRATWRRSSWLRVLLKAAVASFWKREDGGEMKR